MYHNFFTHSFTDGHLGCLQHLAIVNCAAMNIGVHRFFWIGVSGLLGYNLTFNWNIINNNNNNNKQNITRDTECKNNLTVTRREVGGDNEGKGFQDGQNQGGGWKQAREGDLAEVAGSGGEKM